MKDSIYLIVVLTFFMAGGCNQKPSIGSTPGLVGIWQNKTAATSAIEFTNNGEYYLRINNRRLDITASLDSTVHRYIYDSISNDINLRIYSKINGEPTKGKLVFLDSDKIKISLINADKLISETEFFRIRE